jgi:hypothetical protein
MVVVPVFWIWNTTLLVEEETWNIGKPGKVVVPWTTKVPKGVVEPMPRLPLAFKMARVTPVEEVILKGSKVVVPCTLKLTVEDVALTPATVPLSAIILLTTVEAVVNLERKPLVPVLPTLLLKVRKSEPWSCPVVLRLEMGRLITKALVVVVMLKMLPAVPVETLLTTPEARLIVEVPERLTPVPAVKRELISEKIGAAEPLLLKTWKEVPAKLDLKVEPS